MSRKPLAAIWIVLVALPSCEERQNTERVVALDDTVPVSLPAGSGEKQLELPHELADSIPADAEAIARDAMSFLGQLAPELARRGVYFPTQWVPDHGHLVKNSKGQLVTALEPAISNARPDGEIVFLRPVTTNIPTGSNDFKATIGDRTQVLWRADMTRAQKVEAAAHNLFILLNKTLADAGSEERLYGIQHGKQGRVIFLTPERYAQFQNTARIPPHLKPWEPRLSDGN